MLKSVGVLIFARMNSKRLPGKMLKSFGGMALLDWVWQRAQAIELPCLVATSDAASDDTLADHCAAKSMACFRGPLNDVLLRAKLACQSRDWDAVLRLCGDRPFFDTAQMRLAADLWLANSDFDLISNLLPKDFPPAPGLSCELLSRRALEKADANATRSEEREHLSQYLYTNLSHFRHLALPLTTSNYTKQRFAVDSEQDLYELEPLSSFGLHVPTACVVAIKNSAVPA